MLDVQVTCPDEATALAVGRAAVEARLAACANATGPVRSLFWWDGAVQEEGEWMLALKTRAECFDALVALVRGAHPYDLPAVIGLEGRADAETEAWIAAETTVPGGA